MAGRSGGGSTAASGVREPLPVPISGCWCCFALHISSAFIFHLPTAGWIPLLEVSLLQSQLSGKKVLGPAIAVCSQPSAWPLCNRFGLPDMQTPGATAAPQLLITGVLFSLYWAFPSLPFCVSLSIVSVMETSLFGSQLWLLCRSGSLMFGTVTE